jgi:hypothetical protein
MPPSYPPKQEQCDIMQQIATLETKLTPAQEKARVALLEGKTVVQAAMLADVNRATLHRWLKDDFEFQASYNRGQRDLYEAVQSRLLAMANKAVGTVEQAIQDGDVKSAVALLKGLGLLSGDPLKIGSADPTDLESEANAKRNLDTKVPMAPPMSREAQVAAIIERLQARAEGQSRVNGVVDHQAGIPNGV